MVMTQVGYFFRISALALSACCPLPSTSELSKAKKTGWNGEFLLIWSMSRLASVSSTTGSGGTGVGSATGSGGEGGRVVPDAPATGGGVGRATGGCFFAHAAGSASATNTQSVASFL